MLRQVVIAGVACVALGSVFITAQTKPVPRPPAQAPGQQPAGESAAPDGYAPIPQWLGQTRAPVPAKTEEFTVETVAEGFTGIAFRFLPDGRILLGERNGRIRIVSKDGKVGEALAGIPPGQGVTDVQPDKNFSANRTIYFGYTAVPPGVDASKQRSPAHFHVASAKMSADEKRLEDIKELLDAEGTNGRVIQAHDGT